MADPGDLADFVDLAERTATAVGDLVNELPAVGAAYRQFCRIVAGTPGSQILAGADIQTICTPVWADDGRGAPTEGAAPYTGGQCFGQTYTVEWREVVFGTISTGLRVGPIRPIQAFPEPGQTENIEFFVTDQNGNKNGQSVGTSGTAAQNLSYEIVSVTPLQGESDVCGDPPGTFQPGPGYDGEQFGTPDTIVGPSGDGFTVNVDTPFLDNDGNLVIPVSVDDVNFNLGTGGNSNSGPGPTSSGAPIMGTSGSGEQQVPDLGPGIKCIAIALTVSGLPTSIGFIANTTPNERTFGVFGNFTAKQESDDGITAWTPDQILNQVMTTVAIQAEGLRITSFRVNILDGMSYIATPIYRTDTDVTGE